MVIHNQDPIGDTNRFFLGVLEKFIGTGLLRAKPSAFYDDIFRGHIASWRDTYDLNPFSGQVPPQRDGIVARRELIETVTPPYNNQESCEALADKCRGLLTQATQAGAVDAFHFVAQRLLFGDQSPPKKAFPESGDTPTQQTKLEKQLLSLFAPGAEQGTINNRSLWANAPTMLDASVGCVLHLQGQGYPVETVGGALQHVAVKAYTASASETYQVLQPWTAIHRGVQSSLMEARLKGHRLPAGHVVIGHHVGFGANGLG